jgi:rhamnose utilization protein RhaD (predicted bifunctional aldolase and dehydrogenase)
MTPDPELEALRAFSASNGRNPALTQAAGGNTSIKIDGIMWIKASGTWLSHSLDRDIFVPVQLDRLREGLAHDDPACETCLDYVDQALNPTGLRPSVETTVHGLMPQRVVVHVHCVETISWAVRADAEDVLTTKLEPFSWRFIPYARPGVPLAHAMMERLRPGDDVVILGNHGLVVASSSVAGAEALLSQVTRVLRRPARPLPPYDLAALARIARDSNYRLPDDFHVHSVATDPTSLGHACKGSLYPDHVVFLGPGVFVLAADENLEQALQRAQAGRFGDPPIILVPGRGIIVHRRSVAAVEPMARCLADVTARIDPDEPVRALAKPDVDVLVNWDAEKYRHCLAHTA